MKLSHKFILAFFFIIIIIVLYKLYKSDNHNNIESFSVINKLNNISKKRNNNKNKNKDNKNKNNKESTKNSIDELIKKTESIDPNSFTFEKLKEDIVKYSNSFKKDKFKNNSKNTAESFEKFALYKEKLFEIFKN